MIDQIIPFGIALLIGLIIGIERERRHPAGSRAMGVRTFMLIALLGTLAATSHEPFLTLATSLFVFGVIALSYHKASEGKRQSLGLTTEIAAAVVFFLGYLTPKLPLITSILGIIVLLALFSRTKLHVFSRDTVKNKEITAAIIILVIGLVILPFLPNHVIDPWEVFNPRRYALLILILAIIEFSGYIAIRIFGDRLGLLLTAFFGGLVSSTAAFLILTKLSKNQKESQSILIASGLLATNAMLIVTIVLLSILSHTLIHQLFVPILSMIAIGFLRAWSVIKNNHRATQSFTPDNPLDLKGIFKLATFIVGMLAIITIAKQNIGANAVALISFLGGLFEVHSVNIANATLFIQSKLSLIDAKNAIGLALSASFITKFFLAWSLGDKQFALKSTIYLVLMLLVGILTFIFV